MAAVAALAVLARGWAAWLQVTMVMLAAGSCQLSGR
jgi:hypothetical protein